jgi:flagellar biogenesis protein FliO
LLVEFIVFLGGCADGLSSAVSFSIAIAFAALAAAVAPSAFFYYVVLSFALVLIRGLVWVTKRIELRARARVFRGPAGA